MAEIFTGGPLNRGTKFIEEAPASLGAVLGADYERAFETNPTVMGIETYQRSKAGGEWLDKASVERMARESGVMLKIPAAGMTAGAASIAIESAYRKKLQESIGERSQGGFFAGVARFGAGALASLFDPMNIGASLIPFAAGTKWGATIASAASTASQRATARAFIGVTEGALGTAAVEPFVYRLANDLQKDYTMADSLLNVAFGTILGGGLHVGGGALADVFARTGTTVTAVPQVGTIGARVATMPPEQVRETTALAVAQAVNGRTVDVEAVMPEVWRANARGDPMAGQVPGYVPAAINPVTGTEITSPQVKAYYDAWVKMREDTGLAWGKTEAGPREPTAIELAMLKASTERFLRDSPPTQEQLLTRRAAAAAAEITRATHERENTLAAAELDQQTKKSIKDIAQLIDKGNELPNVNSLAAMIAERPQAVRDALAAIHEQQNSPKVLRSNRPPSMEGAPSPAAIESAQRSARPENMRMYDAQSVAAADERIAAAQVTDDAAADLQRQLQTAVSDLKSAGIDAEKALAAEDEHIATVAKEGRALEFMMSCQLRKG